MSSKLLSTFDSLESTILYTWLFCVSIYQKPNYCNVAIAAETSLH